MFWLSAEIKSHVLTPLSSSNISIIVNNSILRRQYSESPFKQCLQQSLRFAAFLLLSFT